MSEAVCKICGHSEELHKLNPGKELCWGNGAGSTAMEQQYGCGCTKFTPEGQSRDSNRVELPTEQK